MRSFQFVLGATMLLCANHASAQSITSVTPRTVQPGQSTKLTIQGTELTDALRIVSSSKAVALRVDSLEPTQVSIQVEIPPDFPLGPFGLLIGGANGPLKQLAVLVDDLPAIADNAANHARDDAQVVSTRNVVEGTCDGATSDFYKFNVTAGQQVAFEVQSQMLQSTMDPVLRLTNADGDTLHLADDGAVGPDTRFAYQFEAAGDYWVEVIDSRHAAIGALYQLRIGDFPAVDTVFPLAIQAGQSSRIGFVGTDAGVIPPREFSMSPDTVGFEFVAAKMEDGQSSTWVPVATSFYPQVVESQVNEALSLPVGISGQLLTPQEADTYELVGVKDQAIRVSSRTRSLGCQTLLQMELLNPAGVKVAETKISAADEWSFDYTFPEDGIFRLVVNDLLKRGGDSYSYWIEVSPAGVFQVALKAEAAVKDEFILEPGLGAAAIDLVVTRFGYDGEIEVSLAEPVDGMRIVNPRIAASAAEARLYLQADAGWDANGITSLRLVAASVGGVSHQCFVTSRAMHRAKFPAVLSPPSWNDGRLFLAASAATPAPFALEPTTAIQFAKPLNTHVIPFTLKRLQEGFTGAVTILGGQLPTGWQVTATSDKDAYTTTFTGKFTESAVVDSQENFTLQVFGDVNGHGRIESVQIPVQWIDPLQVDLQFPDPLIAGGSATVRASIRRDGNDPQPATLSFPNLPTGLTAPDSLIVTAEQSYVDFSIQLGPEALAGAALNVSAASKYAGQDFSVSSTSRPLPIVSGPTQLAVYPAAIELSSARSQQQLVVSGMDTNLAPRDWTRFARYTIANPEVAAIDGTTVVPKADGDTELTVSVGSLSQTVPIRVVGASTKRSIEFESEVLVALSKQGCNSGACHGSPSGKGGFRLSLRAFDMQLDELTLIREEFGRRVNPLEPEKSLLVLKPLMKVAHGGGKQLRKEDAAYRILLDWIAGGARSDPADMPRIDHLEVYPHQKQVLSVSDGGQQLAVTAFFTDGSRRDVTQLAAYETSDTSVATVDVHGFVTPHGRGEIAILVRFLEHIESLPLMFVEQTDGFEWNAPTPNNYVDDLVNAKLKQLQYLPSETCTDAEFLRRASLDVLGILPSVAETQAFLADASPEKRVQLVDRLLERDEYAKFWALKWGDLLRMTGKLVGDEGVYKYHRWVEESLRSNMPYDQFAKNLLTGAGSTLANPPANFYRTATDMNECVETISQVFLGARLQCAKCHNHPFERWTQDNYYGLGAFFNRVERRTTERPGEMFVYTSFSGDVTQPRTGQVMSPWLPHVGTIEAKNDVDRRYAFAEWLVQPSNPYFARIEANRIWSQLFSRGIVDPIDDFRDSNPPANALLLDALAKDFVDSGFDRKHLLRTILNSRTYQASYQTNTFNQQDVTYGSHQEPRLLSAEQLLDAINQTLDLKQTFGTLPAGTKATQLPAPDLVKVDFLKTFGQPERSTVCACERADDSNLGMAIELFNGPMIHEKLRDENNRFRKALAAGKNTTEVVQELYLAAVCRMPSDIELKASLDHCAQAPSPAAALEDICWALFNTDEFLFQH